MARILVTTAPMAGHVYPALSIVRGLLSRGHRVWWYSGQKFRDQISATGATFIPFAASVDFDDADMDASFKGRKKLSGIAQLKFDMMNVFLGSVPGHTEMLTRIYEAIRFQIVVNDIGFLATSLFSELSGIPSATFGTTALTMPSRDTAPFGLGLGPSSGIFGRARNRLLQFLVESFVFRPENSRYQQIRAMYGLPRSRTNWFLADAVSPDLYLHPGVPEFEYPRSDLPPHVRFVGPFLPPRPQSFPQPDWWSELEGIKKPVVHVTQGTLATEPTSLILPTLAALAGDDVLVVATTGGKPVSILGHDLPANVRVASFIPHAELLPKVNVMVTNGGYGGVQAALACGVPLVVAGATEDKPEVARRVAWSRAGISLRTGSPSRGKIRHAVHMVLEDPSFRSSARALQQAIGRHHPVTAAVDEIEAVLLKSATAGWKPDRQLRSVIKSEGVAAGVVGESFDQGLPGAGELGWPRPPSEGGHLDLEHEMTPSMTVGATTSALHALEAGRRGGGDGEPLEAPMKALHAQLMSNEGRRRGS